MKRVNDRLNIGIIGLGRIGRVHLENLVYRLSNAGVCAASDPDHSAREYAGRYGIPELYENAEDVLSHKDIQAVVICSPTDKHMKHIEAAAAAGKHIFCEKPLEMSVDKIKWIETVVETQKVKLQVGFNRRFDANFSRVHDMVKEGKIGQPHILKITSRDSSPPSIDYIKTSGGMFMDMTVHDFDMARFIVGSEISEVFTVGEVLIDRRIGEAGDVDTAVITLKFENGCIGVIDNSRKAVYGYDQRLEIFGSKGMSFADNNFQNNQVLYDVNGRHGALPMNFFMDRYTEAYCREMKYFIDAVREDREVSVGCHDALMATKLAVAARTSMEEQRMIKIE